MGEKERGLFLGYSTSDKDYYLSHKLGPSQHCCLAGLKQTDKTYVARPY